MLSLILPAYEEEAVVDAALMRCRAAMDAIGYPYEIIVVDDGSTDGTLPALRALSAAEPRLRVLSLSRNFGHQLAVTAGMDAARGDVLIIMDMDLQDPPEVIADMVKAWEQGADIAYGRRVRREGESAFKKLTAHVYYRLLTRFSAYPIPMDTGDFRLLDRKVADQFLAMREHDRFLRGMSAWMGYRAVPVDYVRAPRAAGETKYTLKKMFKLAADGILGFSDTPLLLPFTLGTGVCVLSLLGLLALLICALGSGVAPWLWAVCGLTLLNGLVLLSLGILGAYVARILHEVKGRPLYIIKEIINGGDN